MSQLLPLLIALPLAAALLMLPAGRFRKLPPALSLLVALSLLAVTVALYFFRQFNFVLIYNVNLAPLPGGGSLVLDGLSHLLLLTVTLIACLVIAYAIPYMERYTGLAKFYALYMLMLAGMIGVVLAGDLFSLFIFLEVAAIATYALVAFGTGAEELEAAVRYLIIGSVASLLILFGIGLVYALAGTSNMAEISRSWPPAAGQLKAFIAALFIAGFGMKAALVPFHSWLPDAHTAAPAPISATLSGVLIKTLGVYALARVLFNVLGMTPQLSLVLMLLGTVSILVGVLLALGQWDFKRLLAYHSISQVGYVILGIGLATPLGIMGGLFHLFNHALFKALLFLNAGAIEYRIGTRDLKEMGGLARKLPVTSTTSFLASMSIAGVPPFNGFWSKLFIIVACVQAGRLWFALAAVLGSILTLSSFLKVQKYAFFDKLKDKFSELRDVPWLMGSSMVVLALLCLLAGVLFPYLVGYVINPAVVALSNGLGYSRLILGGM